MNIINLKGEDLEKILRIPEDAETLSNIWLLIAKKSFIFDRFIVKLDLLQQEYRVKFKDEEVNKQKVISITKVQNDDHGLPLKIMKYETNVTSYITKLSDYIKDTYNKSLSDLIRQGKWKDDFIDVVIPMSLIQYVIWKSIDRETVIIESKKRKQTGQKKKYNRKKKNEYKLIDCIKIYRKKNKNAGYTYTVDEFERRGYIRHYKNGKTVLVKPTIVKPKKKGENKTKKEYKL